MDTNVTTQVKKNDVNGTGEERGEREGNYFLSFPLSPGNIGTLPTPCHHTEGRVHANHLKENVL